jgi:N-acetylglucosaminyldiphosphoundecaprenol N-acetyl-beta-D-mannosaminyltransferase
MAATVDTSNGSLLSPRRPPGRDVRVGAATVMGLPFDRLDHDTLVQRFRDDVQAGRGGWICTPNLDILRQFTKSPESRELVMSASCRVADGLPIVWAARLAGRSLPERLPGSDFVMTLPGAAAAAGQPVFLLGGNPGVAEIAAARLRELHPGIEVAYHCPPFGFESDDEALETIRLALRRAKPGLVLVGLGFPKQERLIRLLRDELPGAWFAGVGISLSFIAGDQRRAPEVLQRCGLEWVHRLAQEPRRLAKRYLVLGLPFAARLLAWAVVQRVRGVAH